VTPDAYQGEQHDPMTQRPYMWNRSNPTSYADPSGFDYYVLWQVGQAAYGFGHQAIFVVTGANGAGVLLSNEGIGQNGLRSPANIKIQPMNFARLVERGNQPNGDARYQKATFVQSSKVFDQGLQQSFKDQQSSGKPYSFINNSCTTSTQQAEQYASEQTHGVEKPPAFDTSLLPERNMNAAAKTPYGVQDTGSIAMQINPGFVYLSNPFDSSNFSSDSMPGEIPNYDSRIPL
jgi:hypothetical protein